MRQLLRRAQYASVALLLTFALKWTVEGADNLVIAAILVAIVITGTFV